MWISSALWKFNAIVQANLAHSTFSHLTDRIFDLFNFIAAVDRATLSVRIVPREREEKRARWFVTLRFSFIQCSLSWTKSDNGTTNPITWWMDKQHTIALSKLEPKFLINKFHLFVCSFVWSFFLSHSLSCSRPRSLCALESKYYKVLSHWQRLRID